jgi:glycosyl transferase, family 25
MNTQGQLIKIYIINLKRSKERRGEMIRKMNSYGLEYEFFQAIDGQELSKELLDEIYSQPYSFKKAFGREMTLGEIGCAMSHLNLYKKVVDEKTALALILEDDIDMDKRLEFVVRNIRTKEILKKKFDLILLGYSANGTNYKKKAEVSLFGRNKLNNQIFFGIPTVWNWSTIGYLISRTGAQKLLEQGLIPRMPADFLTANSPKCQVRLGIANKPIVWPGELDGLSLIGGGRGHPNENVKIVETQREYPKDLTETLKQVYRNLRSIYYKKRRVIYGELIKFIPRHYLYVSDKF